MSRTKLIIVNGSPRCGKDTFVNMFYVECREKYGRESCKILTYSTVDTVKDIAERFFDYKGEKNPYWRQKLSNMKVFFDKEFNLSNNEIKEHLNVLNHNKFKDQFKALTVMIREPQQIKEVVEMVEKEYNDSTDVYTIFIDSNRADKTQENDADKNVENYTYDIYVANNYSLEHLREKVNGFVEILTSGGLDAYIHSRR